MGIMFTNKERTKCEQYVRVMGYMRQASDMNIGKRQEAKDRLKYSEKIAMESLNVA